MSKLYIASYCGLEITLKFKTTKNTTEPKKVLKKLISFLVPFYWQEKNKDIGLHEDIDFNLYGEDEIYEFIFSGTTKVSYNLPYHTEKRNEIKDYFTLKRKEYPKKLSHKLRWYKHYL